MKAALYARVSTTDKDQNTEVQLSKLRDYCQEMDWIVYQEYVDQASAADMVGRKAWTQLMKEASWHRFDVLLVWKLDRAFRSVVHAAVTLKQLQAYHVSFKSYMEAFMDTTSPHGEFIFYIMAAAADLERQMLIQRVRAGMDYARKHGTKSGKAIGRPRRRISNQRIYAAFHEANGNYSQAGRLLGVSPGFIHTRIKRGEFSSEEVLSGEYLNKR